MYRLARWLALCAIAIFALFLIVLSVRLGKAGGHAVGDWVLWAGCAGCLTLCVIFVRFVAKAQKAAHLEKSDALFADAMATGRFEARGRSMLIPGCIAFGIFGAGMLYGGIVTAEFWFAAIGAASLLFGTFGAYEVMRQLLRAGPMLTLDRDGIDHAMYGRIPWREVLGIHLEQVETRYTTLSTLHLGVERPYRFVHRAPLLLRLIKRAWKRQQPDYGGLSIGLNSVSPDPELIHRIAMEFRDGVHPARMLHWHPRMSDAQLAPLLKLKALNEEMNAAGHAATEAQVAEFIERAKNLERELGLDPAKRPASRRP